ncbi:MAG: HNH endonuclease [Bacilli bacterium]
MFNFIMPKIHIELEKWKFNKNYNLYVSNMGNFKDKNKEDINLKVSQGGYMQVPVCNNKKGTVKYLQAHRVVMETWCPLANMWKDKLTVDHLNHNKRDNSVKNLEWVSKKENLTRATMDYISLDLEKENQKLKDKIKFLETQLLNMDITIILNDIKSNKQISFYNWYDVKNYLITIGNNANIGGMSINILREKITSIANKHQKYFGFYWEVKKNVK